MLDDGHQRLVCAGAHPVVCLDLLLDEVDGRVRRRIVKLFSKSPPIISIYIHTIQFAFESKSKAIKNQGNKLTF